MLDSLPLGSEELDQLSRIRLLFWLTGSSPIASCPLNWAGAASGIFDGHVPLLASSCPVGDLARTGLSSRP
jgi:hypothetical protein